MRNGNHTKDSWLDAGVSTIDGRTGGVRSTLRRNAGHRPGRAISSFVAAAVLLAAAGPALGQFSVEPMKIEVQVTPGKMISQVINIRNYMPDQAVPLGLKVVDLSQSEDGHWMVVDPNGINDPNSPCFGFDMARLSSCKGWVRLARRAVTLDPAQVVPVEVTLRVPRGLRGFYTAGIVISMATSPNIPGMGMTLLLELIVPIIVEIEGRAVTPRIEATDVGMQFVPVGGSGPATTGVSMRIENNGGTYSRLRPIVRIWSLSGGYWRVITTREFGDHGIIPGARINLKTDLHKSLPSGKYKVAAELYVDGRRTRRFQKEIDFAGDPRITELRADRPLDLEPWDITIDSLPGSTRAGTIKVHNGADATVHVRTALGLPPILQQRASGEIKGEDLDASAWLKVIPDQFTLQGEGGRQNIQIIATMPSPVATHPCYYAMLALWATYPDGQQAGVTTMPICVRNSNIAIQPEAEGLTMRTGDLGQSKLGVAATFINQKGIHFAPITVRAGVIASTDISGVPRVSEFLTGDTSLMLPFEMRTFSGVLDLSTVPADTYFLVARLEYAPGQFARTFKLIQVSIEGDQRVVRTIGTQDEMGTNIEIKW